MAPTEKKKYTNVVNIPRKWQLNRKDNHGIIVLLSCLTHDGRPLPVVFGSMTGRLFILKG